MDNDKLLRIAIVGSAYLLAGAIITMGADIASALFATGAKNYSSNFLGLPVNTASRVTGVLLSLGGLYTLSKSKF
jgi:hypothetical protein